MDCRCIFRVFVGFLVGFFVTGISFGGEGGPGDPVPPFFEEKAAASVIAWSEDEIAGDIGAFSHVSVAVDELWGTVFVAYYDAVNGDLRWARTIDSGGNCGPGDSWKCEAIHTDGDVGKYNSIAVRGLSGGWSHVILPFYDATNERLLYLSGLVSIPGDVFSKDIRVIDDGFAAEDRTGMYTAVQFDSSGAPWIAYQNETYGAMFGTHRMIAQWVGDGSGNCGGGVVSNDWKCSGLFSNGYAQSFSSTGMAIDDQDRPVVAFYDDFLEYPVLARYVESGGTCGPSNSWRCFGIPPRPGDTVTGKHVVPFVADGSISVFYQNTYREKLERATYVYPAAGNCGWSGVTLSWEWQCESIHNMDGNPTRGISVAADLDGYPIVAFQYGLDPGPGALAVARPVAAPGVDSPGNCGVGNAWHCEIVDSAGAYLTEADSVSIAVDSLGTSFVGYHERNDYPFPAEYNLKMATLPGPVIFIDGFESGATSAWSLTVVPVK